MDRNTKGKTETRLHLNQYTEMILNKRKVEVQKIDPINEWNMRNGSGFTSPTTGTSTEEVRLLMDYIDKSNLFTISKLSEERGKVLKYRKFFKSKRNQQVEIFCKCGSMTIYKEGKVSTVGRDFVMLTNLKNRIWIPYTSIISANIPSGIPNYSNTHQHVLFDNNLRNKLLRNFGETVANRDVLKQLFFEESLQTNLESWRDSWVEIHLDDKTKKIGKLLSSNNKKVFISYFTTQESIQLSDIQYIETVRFYTLFSYSYKHMKRKNIKRFKNWTKGGVSRD